ncbi:MAG: uracil-DNA glycosylase family protein [Ahrensia sp.]|nr:uracil-DNA glycosylase family protein [Ahrensia sp.]
MAKQIRLCAPKIVILLGNTAARHVMQSRQTITQVRGKWTKLPDFGIEAIAIFEPAMLLSQPQMKRTAWMDLLAINAKLGDI